MKGPGIFLAQFAGDEAPFNDLGAIARWAAGLGYKGVQIPTWDRRLFNLKLAAESDAYCDEVRGVLRERALSSLLPTLAPSSSSVRHRLLVTDAPEQMVALAPAFLGSAVDVTDVELVDVEMTA